jgi:hypothetical protein
MSVLSHKDNQILYALDMALGYIRMRQGGEDLEEKTLGFLEKNVREAIDKVLGVEAS